MYHIFKICIFDQIFENSGNLIQIANFDDQLYKKGQK